MIGKHMSLSGMDMFYPGMICFDPEWICLQKSCMCLQKGCESGSFILSYISNSRLGGNHNCANQPFIEELLLELYSRKFKKPGHACKSRHPLIQTLKPDEKTQLLCIHPYKQKQYSTLYWCNKQSEKKSVRT